MASKKITASNIEKLIELVRANPAIYDVQLKEHKDSVLLRNIWESIAAATGVEGMDGKFMTLPSSIRLTFMFSNNLPTR